MVKNLITDEIHDKFIRMVNGSSIDYIALSRVIVSESYNNTTLCDAETVEVGDRIVSEISKVLNGLGVSFETEIYNGLGVSFKTEIYNGGDEYTATSIIFETDNVIHTIRIQVRFKEWMSFSRFRISKTGLCMY